MTTNNQRRKWLRKLRKDMGMTQYQMAVYLGIPKTTYSSYEQGYRTPEVDTAKTLGGKLSIDWTYFFEDHVRVSTTKEAAK
ncbi:MULTISPECIES: helix-turn-helix domain-containing protein [Schleiferilactobacillus]|nr:MULTISPECIES: helix-turn-helix transcriptional regulator [Schleiferilactobacillus]MCI2170646.1 helix-turn-helix domain-containing protein [Schleiferilactobacillus perolens]